MKETYKETPKIKNREKYTETINSYNHHPLNSIDRPITDIPSPTETRYHYGTRYKS